MTHVLIYSNDELLRAPPEFACIDAGHTVTIAPSEDAALMALRASLHPMVAILDGISNSPAPLEHMLATLLANPARYGQHRYIVIYASPPKEPEQPLLDALRAAALCIPNSIDTLLERVAEAAASFSG